MNAPRFYFLLILIVFFSCDANNVEPEFHFSSPQVRSVHANEIPNVIDQISQSVKRFNSNPYSANNEGIDLSNLSYTEILEVIDTLDNKNYTFRLDDEDDNPFTFTNLLVKKE